MPNADSEFFTSFNSALEEMESEFGETWKLERTDELYSSIAMDHETIVGKVMSGGNFEDSQSLLFVREEIFQCSGVKEGDIICIRDQRFSVTEIDRDGDAARTLILGPVSIDVWGK